ncbi:hypothetical protein Mgra_00008903 [Meloidogyne graminicola]|uniref:Transmembrane protein n=1 Tax=Meloidogyne graminicola TaxID=189291 RepID=A0A8S9ZEE5_9BILA|nr:hypothetical protein Mgra_00008903 [Meloidogyne graminicola]
MIKNKIINVGEQGKARNLYKVLLQIIIIIIFYQKKNNCLSSLSHRFQISENIKCARLLLKVVLQIGFCIILLLAHSLWMYTRSLTLLQNQEQQNYLISLSELQILIMPILSITTALSIIKSSKVLSNKTKLIIQKCWKKITDLRNNFVLLIYNSKNILLNALLRLVFRWRSAEEGGNDNVNKQTFTNKKKCMKCGTAHEVDKKALCETKILIEYWEDYLHIQ